MNKKVLGTIAAIVLLVIGFLAVTKPKDTTSTSSTTVATSHREGKGTTGITLIEYGDFQCPYCQQYHPMVKEVQAKYNDQIYFQFRNYPLESLHKNARAASRAAEAADLQGKFWEMFDKIYENSDPQGASGWVASDNPYSFFEQYAKAIGLNLTQFKTDFASSKVNNRINADMTEGAKLKITGTPTFYLDGKKLDPSPTSVEAFSKVIDSAIAAKAKK